MNSDTVARPGGLGRAAAIARFLIAWIGTLTILPYTWGRTIIYWMSEGAPERYFLTLLIATVAVSMVLTYNLGAKFQRPATKYQLLALVFICWTIANAALIWLYAGNLIPPLSLLPVFLPATLFVIWMSWFGFLPLKGSWRLGVTAVTALLVVPFFTTYRVAGLTGDGRIDFEYRSKARRTFAEVDTPPAADSGAAEELIVQPGDFPQFLGPDRIGVITDVTLARDWEASPPKLLWRRPVGTGWSGFSVVGNRALTQEQRNDKECVVCYDLDTGNEVWIHEDDANFDSSLGGPGPRGTPTVRDNRVYTWGATGILNCLDGSTGEPIWSHNVLAETDASNLTYGTSTSPLVTDTLVMIGATGGQGPSLMAYDRETGERVFAEGDWRTSYSSPRLTEIDGVPQILNLAGKGLLSHDPETGKVLWRYEFGNEQGINASQPLQLPGREQQIFLGSGYGRGSALITVSQQDGRWQVREEWSGPEMKTKFTTAVIDGDYVYGLDNGIFACVSLKDGKRVWKRGRYGHGQVLRVGELILVQAEKGDVVLVDPDPEKLIELGRIPALTSKTWNTLAYARGKLIVRNDHEAACYQLPLAAP